MLCYFEKKKLYQREADYETRLAVAENAGTEGDIADWLKNIFHQFSVAVMN
jgi:hypothetical protein